MTSKYLSTVVCSKKSALAFILAASALANGCASAKKKNPELSQMEGKKVALTDVESEDTQRDIVEVALINQLSKRGSFILVSKQDVEAARAAPNQDPRDWKGIAKRAGAEYALRAKVLQFDAEDHEGYSREEVTDSQLAEEQGTDGKTQRLYRVKSLDGHVKFEMTFAHLPDDDVRTGIAEAQDRAVADEKAGAAHLPPRMGFLEKLSNKAFKEFFDRYN